MGSKTEINELIARAKRLNAAVTAMRDASDNIELAVGQLDAVALTRTDANDSARIIEHEIEFINALITSELHNLVARIAGLDDRMPYELESPETARKLDMLSLMVGV